LSVVYGIVQRHHGFIEVASTVGKGTRFDVYFPAASLCKSQSTNPEHSLKSQVQGSGTVLLVDDERAVLDINCEYLESLGYSVLKAYSGDEAIRSVQRFGNAINLIIIDMLMPGKDGRETFRMLKEINPKIRVAFISGYSDERQFADVIKEGALAWFKKPIQLSAFSQKIKDLIANSPHQAAPVLR
jgi:CheY-like chemotaxis protein